MKLRDGVFGAQTLKQHAQRRRTARRNLRRRRATGKARAWLSSHRKRAIILFVAASIEEIEHALVHAYPGWERVLSAETATRGAQWLYADLKAVGFGLQITYLKAVFPDGTIIGIPSYQLPNSPHDVMTPTRKEGRFHVSGSGMDCLDLLKLSRASAVGYTLLGNDVWPTDLQKRKAKS